MTEQQTSSFLHSSTDHLVPDVGDLVAGGLARGRARRRRRRVAAASGALAVVAVAGLGAVALGGGSPERGVDPAVPGPSPTVTSTPTTPPPTPDAGPRALAIQAAAIPDTFASFFPGHVELVGTKENPMDGFDPRQPPMSQAQSNRAGEPGPGIMADFADDGAYVRVAVAPSDPAGGTTPLDRCAAGGQGANGDCVGQPGGGVLQETEFTGGATDGGVTTRIVTFYTPDLWQVTVMTDNTATGGDGPTTMARPRYSFADLEKVATSDVWFGK